MSVRRVAILTAGGFAPCLSAAIGFLIERYTEIDPSIEIITYQHGYRGLLKGDKQVVTEEGRKEAHVLTKFGGSPIGNSRVKLTNAADCVKRGLVKEGENPLTVAAEQLKKDGVDVLHTIGGDDTNTTAADLAKYLHENGYELTVVGLPKTIDNDIIPIKQSLGAWTAAEQAAKFAENIVGEHRSGARMLIIHEVMGRHCGWLTAAAAAEYRKWLDTQEWAPALGLSKERWDIDAVYVPEMDIDIEAEAKRLKKIMDAKGNVNIFLSEGAGMHEIIEQMEASGQTVNRDPFGHVRLDEINPGKWFGDQFAKLLGAEKVMVQKSGYFSRSARANDQDLALIKQMCDYAVDSALKGESGVIGQDEEDGDKLKAIAFPRIAGGKPFNTDQAWFKDLLAAIGEPYTPHVGGH